MVPALASARRRARTWLRARVVSVLAERRMGLDAVRADLTGLRRQVGAVESRTAALHARADPAPFRLEMTVHAAHARHPAVAEAFARRGLPACPACAVGADETLGEAAFAEGFPVADLLAELNALTQVFPSP